MTLLKALALSSGAHEHGARLSFTMQDLEEYTFQVQTQLAAAVRADLERFPKEDLTWRGAMEAAAKVIEERISSPYMFYEPGVWHDYTPGVTPVPVPTQLLRYTLRRGTRWEAVKGVRADTLLWDERRDDTIEQFYIVGES